MNRQQYRQLQKNDPGVKPDPEDKAGAQDSKPDPEDKAKDKAKGKTKAKAKAKDKLNPADPKDEPPAPKGKGVVIDTDGLVADGVDRQQAADWLMLRATRRLPLTASAWNSIKADGAKLGMDAGQVVRECNSRSWCGFKASWIERERREDPVRPEGRRGAGGSVDRRAELMAKLSGSVPAKHMGDVIEGEARDGGLCD
ncbi:hypothetical protein X805_23620 [Sphaerotilus natans subsp. natans DSM 6575]|uniref:Uncharacterized protein n=1 Tax=Sphaerotilus natans subsp. natans DSM 6575 TaxID=1286631 RepID=A0A059KKL3_9BURK|nr:hypothetical protein [Sphaerotilus natans]KDB51992.1 hypothetical protein X805_23620 [Sphaerotilus natans subsp. natans DSM 6575]